MVVIKLPLAPVERVRVRVRAKEVADPQEDMVVVTKLVPVVRVKVKEVAVLQEDMAAVIKLRQWPEVTEVDMELWEQVMAVKFPMNVSKN